MTSNSSAAADEMTEAERIAYDDAEHEADAERMAYLDYLDAEDSTTT